MAHMSRLRLEGISLNLLHFFLPEDASDDGQITHLDLPRSLIGLCSSEQLLDFLESHPQISSTPDSWIDISSNCLKGGSISALGQTTSMLLYYIATVESSFFGQLAITFDRDYQKAQQKYIFIEMD
ncbi:hypothetical protein NEOLI_000083 [Neolecta irregularis DAH-3]|uniref:Uncharacterized protein n=1 Tax=Neolecta irregularis (strain DAH-3) TaxID=1198029 RepID=A0A1U7LVU3_NEOID|nr:hypothetical protein NEOLI_000083 [Neolecta irregularis DAH-3]|eukprot:OLL26631.1 hypothetical protein NEOLI_000083 [Neolecta irregularis DAH-3]